MRNNEVPYLLKCMQPSGPGRFVRLDNMPKSASQISAMWIVSDVRNQTSHRC